MIIHYLQLIRIPGIFTAFSNIFLGYFIVNPDSVDWSIIAPLISTSGFLFLSGMTLNDYFDYKVDRIERPQRPLPSGKISRKTALYLGIIFLVSANLSSLLVGFETIIIVLLMSFLILAYDVKLKQITIIGILFLGSIRYLNVILGGSSNLNSEIFLFALPIFIFVLGISILAKDEASKPSKKLVNLNLFFILATIVTVILVSIEQTSYITFGFLSVFVLSIFIPYLIFRQKTSKDIQKRVTFQLLGIILLDSTLISIFTEPLYPILISIMYLPAYFIIRKLYVT